MRPGSNFDYKFFIYELCDYNKYRQRIELHDPVFS